MIMHNPVTFLIPHLKFRDIGTFQAISKIDSSLVDVVNALNAVVQSNSSSNPSVDSTNLITYETIDYDTSNSYPVNVGKAGIAKKHIVLNKPGSVFVIDGDFETGDLTNWRLTDNTLNIISVEQANSGSYALKQLQSPDEVVAFTNLAVKKDEMYTISAWVYGSGTSAVKLSIGTSMGPLIETDSFVALNSWHQLSVSYAPTINEIVTIRLVRLAGLVGAVYWDDVNVAITTIGVPTGPIDPIPLGSELRFYIDQDTGNFMAPKFDQGVGGYSLGANKLEFDGTPYTRSIITFTKHESNWGLENFITGQYV